MNFWKRDLWYAVRQLRRKPGFTLAVVLTLALGIGANLTVFLIFYGVLLRPLPFPHPGQLVRIERAYPDGTLAPALSSTVALYLHRANRTLSSVAAYDYVPENANLVQGSNAVPVKLLGVSPGFFHVFQMEPRLGRGFNPQDGVQNAAGVVVISDALWRQRFAADPRILGHPVTLGSETYTIVGVAPAAFRLDAKVDIWAPLHLAESQSDHSNQWSLVARTRPGVTSSQVTDDLNRVHLQLKDTYPALWNQYESFRSIDFHDSLTGDVRPALEMLMGAVALLLLIVVVNIFNLLLTRAISMRHELSLRAALGASSWRILRQLLVENALLCLAGGLAGVLLADAAARVLLHLSPLQLPQFSSYRIGAPALGFAAVLTAVCALLFSLVPAFETRRNRLHEFLRLNTTRIASGRHLVQKTLVVSEVAFSLVLLFAAALLLGSFWKLIHTPPGFEAQKVLTFKNSFSTEQTASTALLAQRLDGLTARLEALPGVEAAAALHSLPTQLTPDLPFQVIGRSADQQLKLGEPNYMPVTAHYFDVLRVPTSAGRRFTRADTHGSAPVVIINQQVARHDFKGQNPLGQHILVGAIMGPRFQDSVREIVGVVGDVRQTGLDQEVPEILYLPQAQIPDSLTAMNLSLLGMSWVVRTRSAQVNIASQAQRVFMDNAHAPLLNVEPLAQVVSASVAQQRFSMLLLCGFGLISLALGAAGLYGVMSYIVAGRTKELGVRMALGAQRGDILWMVLREAGLLVGIGLITGILGGLAAKRLLQSLFLTAQSNVPLTLAAMCGVLLLTGLTSAWLPARRAASTEPMQALRME